MNKLFVSQNKLLFIPFVVPIRTTCSFCIKNNPISSVTISLNNTTNKLQMSLSNNDILVQDLVGGVKTQTVSSSYTGVCSSFTNIISTTNLYISNSNATIVGLTTNSNNYISITPVNSANGRIYNLKASIKVVYEDNDYKTITTLATIAPDGTIKANFNNEGYVFNGTLKLVKENNIKASSIDLNYAFDII